MESFFNKTVKIILCIVFAIVLIIFHLSIFYEVWWWGFLGIIVFLSIIFILMYVRYVTLNSEENCFWTTFNVGIAIIMLVLPFIIIFLGHVYNIEEYAISSSVSVSAALLAVLSVLYSNFKSDRNISRQLREDEKARYVELRFNNAKFAIDYLISFIPITFAVYFDLKRIEGTKNVISPRAFLVMQFTSLIVNEDLLSKLPYNVRFIVEKREWTDRFDCLLDPNAKNEFNIIKNEDSDFVLNIIHYSEYIKFKHIFNNLEHMEFVRQIFLKVYSSDIEEPELYMHFAEILNNIESKKIEEIILEDKTLKFTTNDYKKLFEEHSDEKI